MKQTITFEFDPDELKAEIENADSLENNVAVFKQLSRIAKVKAELGVAQDIIKSLEAQAKVEINNRAKATISPNWQVIAGDGYKITRSSTGTKYDVADPEKAKDYVKVEIKPDSEKIKAFQEANSTLPDGIALNPERGETIRITVK